MGVSILTRAMDIVLMIVLAYLPPKGGDWALAALIGSHLLRKAVANCTRPLLRRCASRSLLFEVIGYTYVSVLCIAHLLQHRACQGLSLTLCLRNAHGGRMCRLLLISTWRCAQICALCSVLMDHVPKRHRGKVNALDSVRTFSWSGSAALGG